MNVRVLLLDLDDTLVATRETAWRKSVVAAYKLGLNPPTWEVFCSAYGHKTFEECIHILYGKGALATFPSVYDSLATQFPPHALVRPNVLLQLKQTVGAVGLLTNSLPHKLPIKLAALNATSGIFSWIFHGGNLPALKPNPQVLPWIVKECGVAPREIVFVGDSLIDWHTVAGSGVCFVAVTTGVASRAAFLEAGVVGERIISSIQDLFDLLKAIKGQ